MPTLQHLMGLFKACMGGVLAAWALCPPAILITNRVGLPDIPGSAPHKNHLWPKPLAGGIALTLGIIV
jgi:UDP-N-acetylmuramyl pentapeptide phosphotransferase/UDP-N-acetylglucosamine-1-phosphate transferase